MTGREARTRLSIKVVTPVRVSLDDLERRARRYRSKSAADVGIEVVNLAEAPASLATDSDVRASAVALEREVLATLPTMFDAIMYDCVLDTAVTRLRRLSPVPVFGPTQCTLALLPQVADRFSIVARTQAHGEMMSRAVQDGGAGPQLRAMRTLGISDAESRNPAVMAQALRPVLAELVTIDSRQAVVLGSTTIDIPGQIRAEFPGLRLLCPGLLALRTIEVLWREGIFRVRTSPEVA